MRYSFNPRWNGQRRRAYFGWNADYNYSQPMGIKQAGNVIPQAEPISPAMPELKHEPEYSKQDMDTARQHLKEFKLYSGGKQNLELMQEVAKAVHNGIDPQEIDFKSLTTKDKTLSETLEDERTACMYQDGVW